MPRKKPGGRPGFFEFDTWEILGALHSDDGDTEESLRCSSPGSAHNSHIVSTVGIILSIVFTISAAAFSVAALVRYGESEVANPFVVCWSFFRACFFRCCGRRGRIEPSWFFRERVLVWRPQ